MRRHFLAWSVACLCLGTWASAEGAEVRRLAIVVGSNTGGPGRAALRYSESDAARFARALVEVGEVPAADVTVLRHPSLEALERAFSAARARISEQRRQGSHKSLLFFYFSGHGDGDALELGAERLGHARLKALLAGTGAELRLAFVDSCHSGALLKAGGRSAPAFTLELEDDLAATGEVFVTSSAADELALESSEARGGVFTHHLTSALRGAADASGDGRVSLDEAYRYTFARTVLATGSQHPVFGFRLQGAQEILLSSPASSAASLELPQSTEHALIHDAEREELLAEVAGEGARLIALAPGRYRVQARRRGQPFSTRVSLAAGARERLRWEDLTALPTPAPAAPRALAGILKLAAGADKPVRVCAPPFVNTGVPGEGDYLSAALAATAAAAVGRQGGFLVVPCALALSPKELPDAPGPLTASLRQRLGELDADLLVLGSFRRKRERASVSVVLVHTATGRAVDRISVERAPPTAVDVQRDLDRRLSGVFAALAGSADAP